MFPHLAACRVWTIWCESSQQPHRAASAAVDSKSCENFSPRRTITVQRWTEINWARNNVPVSDFSIDCVNVSVWVVTHGESGPGLWEDEEQLASNPQVQWKALHRLVWAKRGHCQRPAAGLHSAAAGLTALSRYRQALCWILQTCRPSDSSSSRAKYMKMPLKYIT